MKSLPKSFWDSPATPKRSFQASSYSPASPSWKFASYSVQNGLTPSKATDFSLSQATPSTHTNLGYFAFPPAGSPFVSNDASGSQAELDRLQQEEQERQRREELDRDAAWAARLKRDAELRKRRLAQEEAEARHGEEEWVRGGGILRDAKGRRDVVRTQAIKDELKLRDIEKKLVERWEAYVGRWQELIASGKGKEGEIHLRFRDVPWPVDTGEKEVDIGDLTLERVEEFLLGGLTVRGCGVSRKDRVRSSLLRWHPDKMTGVLARVVEDDVEMVNQGVNAVIRCLQMLNSKG
jgi:hypothetical protein